LKREGQTRSHRRKNYTPGNKEGTGEVLTTEEIKAAFEQEGEESSGLWSGKTGKDVPRARVKTKVDEVKGSLAAATKKKKEGGDKICNRVRGKSGGELILRTFRDMSSENLLTRDGKSGAEDNSFYSGNKDYSKTKLNGIDASERGHL